MTKTTETSWSLTTDQNSAPSTIMWGHCDIRIVASSNTSCLDAHAGFFRLLMKGIFDPYVWSSHNMSFDRFLLAVESRDLSQADKSII